MSEQPTNQEEGKGLRRTGEPWQCEVCGDMVPPETPKAGCDQCGRIFAPCCNSVDDNACVECVE